MKKPLLHDFILHFIVNARYARFHHIDVVAHDDDYVQKSVVCFLCFICGVVSHIPKFVDASKSPTGHTASPNCGICDTVAFVRFVIYLMMFLTGTHVTYMFISHIFRCLFGLYIYVYLNEFSLITAKRFINYFT
jgi:hypothetical protein